MSCTLLIKMKILVLGSPGVGKNMQVGKGQRFNQGPGGMKMGRCFTGKADHYIDADRRIGQRFVALVDNRAKSRCIVLAVHRREDLVGAALQRDMKMGQQVVVTGKKGEQRRADLQWFD